jgi:hypothetical protein
MTMQGNETIAVIGLGYVGLPLAVAFGRHRRVIGFDVNAGRIAELQAGRDSTLEVEPEELAQVVPGVHDRPRVPAAGHGVHRHGAHAHRRRAPAGSHAAAAGERDDRQGVEAGGSGDL